MSGRHIQPVVSVGGVVRTALRPAAIVLLALTFGCGSGGGRDAAAAVAVASGGAAGAVAVPSQVDAAAVAVLSGGDAPAVGGPLATARPVAPVVWRGTVVEVVPAGGYVYLWVEGEAGLRWVGTLAMDVAQGVEVSVRPLAELDRYTSARTGRTFEGLQLGMVTASGG
jgi:hypothetical protein